MTTSRKLAPIPPTNWQQWLSAADKALKGRSIEQLYRQTADGAQLAPLYPAAAAISGLGAAPFRRASLTRTQQNSWQIAADCDHPLQADAITQGQQAVAGGVERLNIVWHPALSGRAQQQYGVSINDTQSLQAFVDALNTEVSLSFNAGQLGFCVAQAALNGLRATQPIYLGLQPLTTHAQIAGHWRAVTDSINLAAQLAGQTAQTHKHWRTFSADARPWHEAGASDAVEIAALLYSAVQYLQAMQKIGLDLPSACAQIEFQLSVNTEVFTGMAKLRALRQLWSAALCHLGDTQASGNTPIHAYSSRRMQSCDDPWVNLLRGTSAAAAAAMGGAESITVAPMDAALDGMSSLRAQRLARNTQLLLKLESGLDHVLDPAGGSGLLEQSTTALAQSAWNHFTALIAQDPQSAFTQLQALCADNWQSIQTALHRRQMQRVGNNTFANPTEAPPQTQAIPNYVAPTIAAKSLDELRQIPDNALFSDFAETLVPEQTLPQHRYSEDFERLKARAQALQTEALMRIGLLFLDHSTLSMSRATFARNLFQTAAITFIDLDGVKALSESSSTLTGIVLCGADEALEQDNNVYPEHIPIWISGQPKIKTAVSAQYLVLHENIDAYQLLDRLITAQEARS